MRFGQAKSAEQQPDSTQIGEQQQQLQVVPARPQGHSLPLRFHCPVHHTVARATLDVATDGVQSNHWHQELCTALHSGRKRRDRSVCVAFSRATSTSLRSNRACRATMLTALPPVASSRLRSRRYRCAALAGIKSRTCVEQLSMLGVIGSANNRLFCAATRDRRQLITPAAHEHYPAKPGRASV